MACDDKKRGSIALPTIEESDENIEDIIQDILRTSRRKNECKTPSKKESTTEKSRSSESSARKRTPRHCAEQAREKITTLFNHGDKYGRQMYAVSEDGSDSSESSTYQQMIDEEIMPKGECKF